MTDRVQRKIPLSPSASLPMVAHRRIAYAFPLRRRSKQLARWSGTFNGRL